MEVPNGVIVVPSSRVEVDLSTAGLIHHHPPFASVRAAYLRDSHTSAVALGFSSHSHPTEALQLWRAALHFVARYPQPHPRLVDVYGIVVDSSDQPAYSADENHNLPSVSVTERTMPATKPSWVLMESLPGSLYDALHVEKLHLKRSSIAFIAIEILHALQCLHGGGTSFGSTLTSRKVMLEGSRTVKLRYFCYEGICRVSAIKGDGAVRSISSSAQSHYVMPASATESGSECANQFDPNMDPDLRLKNAQRQDLYAFGVLLLEMCTTEKPTEEIFNRVTCVGQIDRVFEHVVRHALKIPTSDNGYGSTCFSRGQDDNTKVILDHCLQLLIDNEANHALIASERELELPSVVSFSSFVHADHALHMEQTRITGTQIAERLLQNKVALKRLTSVEEELIEEQRNFEILVQQFDQCKLEKGHLELECQKHKDTNSELTKVIGQQEEQLTVATREREHAYNQVDAARAELLRRDELLKRGQSDRLAIEEERQALLVEILKLKDDKRLILDQKRDVEEHLSTMKGMVGNEKDVVEDLEDRLKQAIHRCEQEERSRRKTERQLESANQQLVCLEDDRSRYSAVLQMSPTGGLGPHESIEYVVQLKEKEIAAIRNEVDNLNELLQQLRDQLEIAQQENKSLHDQTIPALRKEIEILRSDHIGLSDRLATRDGEVNRLNASISLLVSQADSLKEVNASLEIRLTEQATKAAEADRARRLRQCLTPGCDAPPYLIKASGYCPECTEKKSPHLDTPEKKIQHNSNRHRRQRSMDEATSVVDCVTHAPVLEILRQIGAARRNIDDADDEARDSDSDMELISLLKKFCSIVKKNARLKEVLPECNALKAIISTMQQYKANIPVLLECCKLLSVIVFNHDRNRIILVADGVAIIVVDLMKRFPDEMKVQETCAVLLTNLSHNSESNRQRIHAAGGIDAVLQAMQIFPRHVTIQKKCCWALLTLAGSDIMCENIASSGGLGAAIASMLNCPSDEDVQHYGSWAILNLVSGAGQLQEFARQEGVVEVVEAAIACFPEHSGIQETCRHILNLVLTCDS